MIKASEFCLEGQTFCSLAALSHPTGLYHREDLPLTWKYSSALWNDLIQWKNNKPWLSACVMQKLGFGLTPVHFFTNSEIDKFISSQEIKKKDLSCPPSYLSLLVSQLSSLFTVWVSENIYLQVQLTAVFAGIDCPRAYLRIELPSPPRNTPPPLISLSPPLPCFLKPGVQSFLLDAELFGREAGALLHAWTWALSDLEHWVMLPSLPWGEGQPSCPYQASPAWRTCRLD